MSSTLILLLAGAGGALIKEIVQDNKLVLPKKIDRELSLGFIGSIIIGAAAGYLIDGAPLTAFLAGYAGFSMIESLISKKNKVLAAKTETMELMIRRIAREYEVDEDLAVRVAKCESGLRPDARNVNSPNSIDRGLYQINSKWHPEVTDEQAYDPEFSICFFCEAVKNGHLSWWNASKNCWNK